MAALAAMAIGGCGDDGSSSTGSGGSSGSAGTGGVACGNLMACEGRCVDVDVDPANCGACGEACAAGEVCAAGVGTGGHDRTVRVWNADGSGEPIVLRGHESIVVQVAYSPDGRHIVSASLDKTIRVWNADGSGEPIVLRWNDFPRPIRGL